MNYALSRCTRIFFNVALLLHHDDLFILHDEQLHRDEAILRCDEPEGSTFSMSLFSLFFYHFSWLSFKIFKTQENKGIKHSIEILTG